MLEELDGTSACGNIFVKNNCEISFIFCSHPLYPNRIDEGFEKEYQEAGVEHACALFSYEDLEEGKLILRGEAIEGLTIYRGWMMKPELYKEFYRLLEKENILLINTPEEYERYHTLPGWYDDFKNDTADSVWNDSDKLESAMELTKGLEGAYIVKDYVKSRKHEWYDACYIPNIADKKASERIIGNFISRQGEDLLGGVVLRKFEMLESDGFHKISGMPLSREYRVFVYAGKILAAEDYWYEDRKPDFSDEEKKWIEEIARKIKSSFVTIDLARRENGTLMIMELGDGQVSGLQQITSKSFYTGFTQGVSIPVEELIPEGSVIISGDPMPGKSIEEVTSDVERITTTQELVDIYVNIHNKFWFIEDDVYLYRQGTDEYEIAYKEIDMWKNLMNEIDTRIMETAASEKLLSEKLVNCGKVKQLKKFMVKYGYEDRNGWWIKIDGER